MNTTKEETVENKEKTPIKKWFPNRSAWARYVAPFMAWLVHISQKMLVPEVLAFSKT